MDGPLRRTHPEVRERIEAQEERLSPFAARSRSSRGRSVPEEDDPLRTAFQRDRDRIIHSKAFRRLKHKTQVFIAPQGDHYRTRLTHTMEVTQVARTIARALNLNEDLTEAIALGHDLGHTPFGHAGEEALAEVLPDGFRHNEQSIRVVEYLEKDGRGLNLTSEVKDGILKHSKVRASVAAVGWGIADTLEGQIVKIADSLAYLAHDIDDATRAGILTNDDIPREYRVAFGDTTSQRIAAMVTDVVDFNWRVALGQGASWRDAVGNGQAIGFSPGCLELVNGLREFLFQRVYTRSPAKRDDAKVRSVIHMLFEYFCKHPEKLPPEFLRNPRGEPMERVVADYIAGMTDRYAITIFESVFVPRAWAVPS
jgi:dGTPase